MKLHLTQSDGNNLITGYAEDYIEINRQRYSHSMIVAAKTLLTDWPSSDPKLQSVEHLTEHDFEKIITLNPEVVLLGTGKTHCFLHPRIYLPLSSHGIALECMTTAAACRTYNILMSEGRNVAAMLII
jgi:uncharacterized protein